MGQFRGLRRYTGFEAGAEFSQCLRLLAGVGDHRRIDDHCPTQPDRQRRGGSVGAGAVIETNRGCPYGCTFCDWGSATLSKVRKFDLDRVYKELEWSARHQIEDASIGDANFGMLERDVAITEKIAELKRTYGFPRSVAINYAKNQVAYLRQIIEIMASVEILAEGVVSLQTTDEQALKDRITIIQNNTASLLRATEVALGEAMDAIAAAMAAGATDEQLVEARDFHRKSSMRYDFVMSENSTGFHSPQEAARNLANAIDFARRAQLSAERLTR